MNFVGFDGSHPGPSPTSGPPAGDVQGADCALDSLPWRDHATAPAFVGPGQPKPEQTGVSTELRITKADEAALGQLGYTPEQINAITPEMASTIFERRTTASAGALWNGSGTLPEEPQQEGKIKPQERILPRCPKCGSFAVYKSNIGADECESCRLKRDELLLGLGRYAHDVR